MLIGILETGLVSDVLRPEHGSYPDMMERLLAGRGFAFRTWSVVNMEFPASVHDAEGWLITGSRHGVYEDHAFIPPLEDLIRAAYGAHVPLVGICFGHQIMAQALGGRVEKFSGGWVVGRSDYDIGGQKLALNAWHQDQVVDLPPGAQVIGSGDKCRFAALAYDDRAFSVQPHPEFDAGYVRGLIEKRSKGIVPDDILARATAALPAPTDNAKLGDMIADFFQQPRKVPHG